MNDEIPMCPSCHTPRMLRRKGDAWFWGLPEKSLQHPTRRLLLCAAHLNNVALKATNLGRQRQNSSEGMPSPSSQALNQKHGKRKHVSNCVELSSTTGRYHWNQQNDATAADDRRETVDAQSPTWCKTRSTAKRLLEEAQLEAQAVHSNVTEASCRVGETMEEMAKIKSLEPAGR